jgi:IS30 family transposase
MRDFGKREKAAYIKLRRKGYTINHIAHAFNRSCSLIWRVLKRNGATRNDWRKIPRRIRELAAQRQRFFLKSNILKVWILWAKGEAERPP